MHPLRVYLDQFHITLDDFAKRVRRCGVATTAGYLSQIIGGYRYPSRRLAAAISRASEGSISVGELMEFSGDGRAA